MPTSPIPEEPVSRAADTPEADVDDARAFALSEDWLATIVGLAVVTLAAAGIITSDWIPL